MVVKQQKFREQLDLETRTAGATLVSETPYFMGKCLKISAKIT